MSRFGTLGNRLYRGEVSYDFVDRRKVWYTVSAGLLLLSLVGLFWKGLTLGIEFRGGAEFRIQAPTATAQAVREEVESLVGGEVVVQTVGADAVRVQTKELSDRKAAEVKDGLVQRFDVNQGDVSTSRIGPSWGADISQKALRALIIFLAGLVVFLSLYFEWKMALAAILALVHDLVITIGIYALVGFEVTPASVIGFLTILGYSLYDTVVVFDKVRENTAGLAGGSRMTYSGAANLALNQTLVRSINTSVIALLPIGAILFAGVFLLGAGPLKDLSLALFIGVAAGTYSSIFIATPLLAGLKEREPGMQALAKRVSSRKATGGAPVPPPPRQTAAERQRAAAASRRAASHPSGSTAVDVLDASGRAELPQGDEPTTDAPAPPPVSRPAGPRTQPPRKKPNRPSGKKRRR